MDIQDKTKKELISELKKLIQENNSLKALKEKEQADFIIANKELACQNGEKEKRAAELIIANKELIFQNGEKEKRAAELIIANKELIFQNGEKEKRAAELIIANKELIFQNKEKEKRAAELIIAIKELNYQTKEKAKRADELGIANKELDYQTEEKGKRADELVIANKELGYQTKEKGKRAAELVIANKELAFQNEEKEKRVAELIIANKELDYQTKEKGKRADELIIANKELIFQNDEKEKRAAELVIANKELLFQNDEKEKRAAELIIANKELLFQHDEKAKRAAELIIANKELIFQNEEKEKRAAELVIALANVEDFEKKFRQIAENIDEVFWLRTNYEMIYVSPSFEKIWGVPVQEIYKDPQLFTEKIHPDDKPVVKEIFQSNEFKEKGLFIYEYRIIRADNQVRWINAKTVPIIDESGQIIKRVGIASDITEKRQTMQELIQAKEHAEESDRLKSAFLANMSHEIRTPMNGILGFSELLKEPGLTGDQQQEYIRIIEKSGVRMLNIINDIVDISKIEAGLMNVNIKGVDINEKIEFIYIFFKPQVEEKGMQLHFKNTLPTKEAIIRTDNEKVNSILTNLVKNAIKYSVVGTIEFGYVKRDETLEFYVKDTGIGIPKDRQSAIFERFIQADINDKMARQGAGLGLSISKAYVEMLGGKIWVESEEGIGSTFYFTLPYHTVPEEKKVVGNSVPAQDENNQINPEVSGLKILIAEDDETSEMLIAIDVEKFCKKVLKARTGNEAVEASRNNSDTDLILMDIQMPEMNGYDATRQIRQFNKDVVIIAQTAFGLSGDRKKAIEAGCNDYLSKPFNKAELLSLIQKYFKK